MLDNASTLGPGSEPQSDDIEALQTDIMRFLSILAICLMVIFALVQAIPLESDKGKPSVDDSIVQRLEYLKNRIEELSRQEQALRLRIQAHHADLKTKRIEQAAVKRELDNVRNALTKEREHLENLQSEVKEKQKSKILSEKTIQGINSRIDERNRVLDGLEAKIEELKKKLKAGNGSTKPPSKKPVVGFSLKFKSEEALIRLIQGKRISFYVGLKGNYWKFSVIGNQIQLKRAAEGRLNVRRMDPETLPESLKEAASGKLASFSKGGINYFVNFPPDMLKQMERKMQTAQGGTLVVNITGKVDLIK